MKFLYAAFAVTWVIHILYIAMMTRGYKRVHEELEDLRRGTDRQ